MRALGHLLLAVGMAAPVGAGAQGLRPSVFTGVVWEEATRNPIAGAEVLLPALSLRAFSDSNGVFRLVDVPAGKHDVTVRRVGYEVHSRRVAFVSNDTAREAMSLRRIATLDSVVVTAHRGAVAEFEQRRALKIGHFIARDELESRQAGRMGDIISRMPGLKVFRNRAGEAIAMSNRGLNTIYGNNPSCYMNVFIDDVAVYRGGPYEPKFNLNTLVPRNVEGIEFYAGGAQAPAKYNTTGSTCGVLVIWTRR
jgi:carboxypeptidase-like protein/TonB-dependent receptor-like protein